MSGWIRLWRSSTENSLYFSEKFTKWQAWADLLLLANHKSNTISVRGNMVKIERGQVAAGREFLAKRWKWSPGKVERFLLWLETAQQIIQQKSKVISIYTITKWDHYQSDSTTASTTDGFQTGFKRYTPKNVKKVENVKKIEIGPEKSGEASHKKKYAKPKTPEIATLTPPTKEMVTDLFKLIAKEKRLKIGNQDGLAYVDRYLLGREESEWIKFNGRPVKNWKLDFRTWISYPIQEGKIKTKGAEQ
jgi:hypothetical protein